MSNNGNGHSEPLTVDGSKVLTPEYLKGGNADNGNKPRRLINPSGDNANPGVRIISNEESESVEESLKKLFFPTRKDARYCSGALNEISIFRYKDKKDDECDRLMDNVKRSAASEVSVLGFGIDQYKQAAISVATNTYTEKGIRPIPMGQFKGVEERDASNNRMPGQRKA